MSCTSEGAKIYYTLDGTDPTSGSTEYTAPFNINATTTIKAIAINGNDESTIATVTATKVLGATTVTVDATGITNTNVYVGTAAGSLGATVKYNNVAIDGASVAWSGDDDDVATINASTGVVTLVGAGTVTFTATFAATSDYAASSATYEMTVTNEVPFVSATYTLANSITSGKHYIIVGESTTSSYAMGAQGNNNRAAVEITISDETATVTSADVHEVQICGPDADGYYTIYDNGYLYAASSSNNYLRTETTLDNNGRWSITFGDEGVANIVAKGSNTRNTMQFNAQNHIFSCYGNAQSDVYLYEKDGEATPTQAVSISAAGMATFCSENALDFTAVDAIHAYYVNVDNSGNLTFTRIRKIPANTGVLLRNAQGEDQGAVAAINVPVLSGEAESVKGNAFVAVLEEIEHLASKADGFNNYILNKKDGRLGFYHANNQKVGAGKAYLKIDESIQARDFFGFNEGEATGIENVNHETTTNGRCYNLNGQQVSANYKGIVIVNGKKTIVK